MTCHWLRAVYGSREQSYENTAWRHAPREIRYVVALDNPNKDNEPYVRLAAAVLHRAVEDATSMGDIELKDRLSAYAWIMGHTFEGGISASELAEYVGLSLFALQQVVVRKWLQTKREPV